MNGEILVTPGVPCFLNSKLLEERNGWYRQAVNVNEVSTDNIFHIGRCSSDGNLTREWVKYSIDLMLHEIRVYT